MAKLYFYYASMNAGKSTNLLQADFNYRERGMRTMLFTAAVDTRFAAGTITSRIGLSAPAVPFDAATDFAYLPCLNDSAEGVEMLRSILARELAGWTDAASLAG